MQKVAHQLREMLDKLRTIRSDEAQINSQGPSAGKTVFLSRKETKSYIDKEWQTVRSTLLSDRATVSSGPGEQRCDLKLTSKRYGVPTCSFSFHRLDRLDNAKAQLQGSRSRSQVQNRQSRQAVCYPAMAKETL